jgi:hypothetical protein
MDINVTNVFEARTKKNSFQYFEIHENFKTCKNGLISAFVSRQVRLRKKKLFERRNQISPREWLCLPQYLQQTVVSEVDPRGERRPRCAFVTYIGRRDVGSQ